MSYARSLGDMKYAGGFTSRRPRSHVIQMPLGDSFTDSEQRITAAAMTFSAAWKAGPVSKLKDVPIATVVSMIGDLQDYVQKPYDALQWQMLNDRSNVVVVKAIAAASQGSASFRTNLLPVLLDALALQRLGKTTMPMPMSKLGRLDLGGMIVDAMIGYSVDYQSLGQIESLKPWYLRLGSITDAILTYLEAAGKAVTTIGDILAKPFEWLDTLITITKWGSIAMLGYWLLSSKKKDAPE